MPVRAEVKNFPPGDLVEGSLGRPDYAIELILPKRGFGVTVYLYPDEARRVVRAALADSPDRLNAALSSTDLFLDELIGMVRDWVATFPLPLPGEVPHDGS